MDFDILADIKLRAQKKTIHELRQIARAVGVVHPADGKKDRLVGEIVKIASCEIAPAPRSARGAPPKSSEYDRELVAEIEDCMEYYAALKNCESGALAELKVSDGMTEFPCAGILARGEKYYFLRVNGCFPSAEDVHVHESYINRFGLLAGDKIEGSATRSAGGGAPSLTSIAFVNGFEPARLERTPFEKLTSVYPENRINISLEGNTAARIAEFFAPLGMGQRALICGQNGSGKTTLLMQIAAGISLNASDLQLVVLLNAARPEEVTLFKRVLKGAELFYTSFADEAEKIAGAAEFVSGYCKRQTECGKNVALIADGLSELESASRAAGVGGAAKRLLSCAVCAEEGCSLTVVAASDEKFADELKPAANMLVEMNADAVLHRIYPAIDALKTSTSHAEMLRSAEETAAADVLRRKIIESRNSVKELCGIIKLFESFKDSGRLIEEILNG